MGFNITKENTISVNAATAQDALEHLGAATAADCTAVANLTSANSKLSSKLQDKNTAYAALQKALEKVQNQIAQLQTSKQTPVTPQTQKVPIMQPVYGFSAQPYGYMPTNNNSYHGCGRRGRGQS